MNVSTIEGWDTTHTTTDDATFYTDDEPRRVYWEISSSNNFDSNEPRNVYVASSPSSTPSPPRRQKRKLSIGNSLLKKGRVSQHTCEACGQPLPTQKDTLMLRRNSNIFYFLLDFNYNYIKYFNCCAYIRIRIDYVTLTMHINMGTFLYGTKLIRTRAEPLRNRRVFTELY